MTDRWPRPAVTCDVVLLTDEPDPRVLLIRRGRDPFAGRWALPGGFVDVGDGVVDQGEDLDEAAYRELAEETGLTRAMLEARGVALRQVGAVGTPYRDPRQRTITVLWAARIPPDLADRAVAGDDAEAVRWVPLSAVDPDALAFDHAELLARAVQTLGAG